MVINTLAQITFISSLAESKKAEGYANVDCGQTGYSW
jgi:hypothetical protein